MKVELFLGMCHIFLISRGLQKNSLLSPSIYVTMHLFWMRVRIASMRMASEEKMDKTPFLVFYLYCLIDIVLKIMMQICRLITLLS